MGSFAIHLFTLFLLVILLPNCDALNLEDPVEVHVRNDLVPSVKVIAHCKSKNSDLGERILSYHDSYNFRFRPNFWGTTRFYCSFAWENELHWFDIYKFNRDQSTGKSCQWKITRKGPCMFNREMNYKICYIWNN
ncbi:hypothetical protein Patl1_25850 [Pistacia atlantica]|uniref:Uncharacterized protein n=1 Tax=Pistacia atlantica TaxID=434234 RepID=A0ACC1AZV2_9ROSI|nr:hypothetical protein Patl1_25850 [Pistacia atlantica]